MSYRIAIIADPIDEQYAGIYTYARELVLGLEALPHEDIEITYFHLRENSFFRGMKECIIPLYRNIPGTTFFRKYILTPYLLWRGKFDLVHDLSHIAPFLFRHTRYKKIFTVFDLTPVLFPQFHIPASVRAHSVLFPFLFKRTDHLIAISEATKRDIQKNYPKSPNITVIPLAAKTIMLEENNQTKSTPPYILFTSTIEPRKNLETLVSAFELLKKDFPELRLVIAGKKGWKCEYIFDLITHSPVSSSIEVRGFVPENELGALYKNAALFVYPSHYEGFGLPILEAMQFGTPVVAANNSSIPEVVGDGGLLFETTNITDLTEKIRSVLSNPILQKTLSEKGKTQYSRFSWTTVASSTLTLYRTLLHEGKK